MPEEPSNPTVTPEPGGEKPANLNPVVDAFNSLESEPEPAADPQAEPAKGGGDPDKLEPGKQADPDKTDDGDLAAGFRKSKDENFAELRKKADDYETRVKELEDRLKTNAKPADYDDLKQQHAELSKIVESLRVEQSPRFKEKYDAPMRKTLDGIQKTLKVAGADENGLLAAIQLPESRERNNAIADAMGELDDFSKSKLSSAIRQYEELREARAGELTDPEAAFRAMSEEQRQKAQQAARQSKAVMDGVVKRFEEKFAFFKKIDGKEAWNQQIDQVYADIDKLWNGREIQTQDMAAAVVAGSMFPMLMKEIGRLNEEYEGMSAELAKFRKASPKTVANGGAPDSGNAEPTGNAVLDAFNLL
jgi:hypothetical protein